MTRRTRLLSAALLGAGVVGTLFLSLSVTEFVLQNESARALIMQFGYGGLLLVSFIAGLNVIVPIPAATFVPIFTAGGITLPIAIVLLVIGTMAANLLAYAAGHYGGTLTQGHYSDIQQKMMAYYQTKRAWLPYFVFGFAAFIPIPDEVYLVPLGLIGIRLRQFIVPLLLGTVVYQTITVLGVQTIFTLLLG